MFIHDIIKIIYVNEGYLPNYPYHMITDKEMFDAFLLPDEGYFAVNYPLLDADLQDAYQALHDCLLEKIRAYLENGDPVPSWVYSYMLGGTISVNSDSLDIDYLYDLLHIEPELVTVFESDLQEQCYNVSRDWLQKLPVKYEDRPATMFGEPHVIKSLRLQQVSLGD